MLHIEISIQSSVAVEIGGMHLEFLDSIQSQMTHSQTCLQLVFVVVMRKKIKCRCLFQLSYSNEKRLKNENEKETADTQKIKNIN